MIHQGPCDVVFMALGKVYDYRKIQYHEALLTCPSESYIKPLYIHVVCVWLVELVAAVQSTCMSVLTWRQIKHCMENGQGEAWHCRGRKEGSP